MLDPLTLNRYSYTANNPVMRIDPSGHTAIKNSSSIGISSIVDSIKELQASIGKTVADFADTITGKITSNITSNALLIHSYLSKKGWSNNAISAVLGNMEIESVTLNPGKKQDGGGTGYGLVQWDPASKYLDWADENGYSDDSLIGQLEYLIYSMQPGNGEWFKNKSCSEYYLSYDEFISSNDSVEYLTQVFLWSYERPGVSHLDRRIEKANYWYEYFD